MKELNGRRNDMLIYPYVAHNIVLFFAAVIPALFLMIRVYRYDRLEPEDPRILWSLIVGGVLSALLALVEEIVLEYVLGMFVGQNTLLYQVLMYYGVVAVSEESSKYIMMKKRTWNSSEFDCLFDGLVYAVFTSLGFALWENISYVFSYGLTTALVRAVTAIPGHACFGVFMGVFYATAKEYDLSGNKKASSLYRKLSVLVPVLFHGTYDFIATKESGTSFIIFFIFVIIMFLISYRLVGVMSRKDRYM